MISLTDESKMRKTSPMENLSNKKLLSECSQYLGHRGSISSAMEEDCHSSNRSSNVPKENIPTNAFTFSMTPSNLESPSSIDKLTSLGNVNYVTPNKGKGERNANCEMINPTASSIDFSALTAADFGISPESFTKYGGEFKSRLKKLRRQSTIGVRGSPENNALIRYIAHRKRMRTEDPPSQASPFQRNVLLRDKIAAFQSSFKPVEEADEKMIHIPYNTKQANIRSHEESQLDQVRPPECMIVALEDALNGKSANGEKTSANIQTIPVLQPNTVESGHVLLEATPAAIISKTACGFQSQTTNEELSSNATSQQSCKKVRFAEKQSLEIFDQTKPPITPRQKGHFPSTYRDNSCLRSVLKKTPIKMIAEGLTEHLDYTSTRKGSEELSVFQSCESLQTGRSTRPIDKMEVLSKERTVEVFDALQPADTSVHSGEASFSPSESRNAGSFSITPMKRTLSQPNFDSDDDLQESSEVVSTAQSVVISSYLEGKETKKCSDLQATCIRATRSSAKKQVNRTEETSVGLTSEMRPKRTCATIKVPNLKKFQNVKTVTKSSPKKTPASRRKAFGKRKRKKKVQKAFRGHYETVSKKPLLSPIPEMTEDVSLTSSYQSTPESSVSILDCSCSSIIHETREKTNVLHSTEEDGSCLHSNLSAVEEDALPDAVSCSSLRLQDTVLNDTQTAFPLEPPSSDSFRNVKNASNGQVLKSDYSRENEVELGSLNQRGTGENNSREASLLVDSAVKQLSGGDIDVNLARFPRRSRRITCHLPSVEDVQSETPGNNSCLPRGSTEEPPCTPQLVNDSGFLNHILNAIEESFKTVASSTQKRVRRSMRRLKNAENEGLAWISVPINDSARKDRRKTYSFCPQESEMLHQKQENSAQILSAMKEEHRSAHVTVEPCRQRKKRKSIYYQGEN